MGQATTRTPAMIGTLGGDRRRARLRENVPWLIFGASVALNALGLVLHLQNRTVPGTEQFFDPVLPGVALAFPLVGAFVAVRRPRSPVAWICCATASVAVAVVAEQYAVYALLTDPGSLPGARWTAWLGTWIWIPGYLALWTVLTLLFPDGRLPTPRWRPVLWVAAGLIGSTTILAALASDAVASPSANSPVPVAGVPALAGPLQAVTVLVLGPVCLAGLWARYRRAPERERPALRWVLVATAAALAVPLSAVLLGMLLGRSLPLGGYQVAGLAALVAVPVAIAVAIVRHGLYDLEVEVDTLVNRLLVYSGLVAAGAGVYLGIVAVAEAVTSGDVGLGPSLVAVAGVALAWRQLRPPLQGAVDRLLYRKRHYDYRVLTSLGQRVQSTVGPDAVLPAIVQTVAAGLKLPHVAVAVGQGDAVVASASYGQPEAGSVVLPLMHQNEVVGQLTVAPRSSEEHFDAADRRLLDDLAGQVGTIAYALCLTADLQRSRERLVSAREEERRRLRRDLHDGLQPALAGITLGLEAVGNMVGAHGTAGELLVRLKCELQAAGADIRHLVYDLRPPALDELGLVGALRQQAIRFSIDPQGVDVVVTAPPDLPALPAAVEVAAYRIGQEALENVRKHAQARTCEVSVELDAGRLRLEVRDDGQGLGPDAGTGVGLVAMRERAAELGGTCSVESSAAGTWVQVTLPVPVA
jgi:two-component system NarL family sensor kinase